MELIEKLELLKTLDKFPEKHWENQEFTPSNKNIIPKMNAEVNKFIDFLKALLENEADLDAYVQGYLDAWDDSIFNTQETDYIVEVMSMMMELVGVDTKGMMM